MVLNDLFSVPDGRHFHENRASFNTFFDFPPQLVAFPHTVSLRLSLQRITELLMLVQHGTLPRVKHLHVTLETSSLNWNPWTRQLEEPPCLTLCPNDFHSSRSDLPDLRTFHLHQVSMSDIILFIQHLSSMARLESLTVINSNVKGM
jgi:hypothetical protein